MGTPALTSGAIRRQRAKQLSLSDFMTLLIGFHCSHYRTFKAYYTDEVQRHLRAEFPALVSYSRFVELTPTVPLPLFAYLRTCLGSCPGISFLDAPALAVCDNHRIAQHHVFRGRTQRGKTSAGWFFGFKHGTCGLTTRVNCSISPCPPGILMSGGRTRRW
jgi:hypothetical protein